MELDDDMSLWLPITITVPVYKDRISFFVEQRSLLDQNLQHGYSFQARGGPIIKLNENASIALAYNLSKVYDKEGSHYTENRLFQELNLSKRFGEKQKLRLSARARFEERAYSDRDYLLFRLRLTGGGSYEIFDSGWDLIARNELFFNINSPASLHAGLAENRFMLGLGKNLNDFVRLEIYYQPIYKINAHKADKLSHNVMCAIKLDIPNPAVSRKKDKHTKTLKDEDL